MKLLTCPINGSRPIQEFTYGGAVRDMPAPDAVNDEQWGDYVFHRNGYPEVKREWWYHTASGVWFIAERDVVNDVFVRTYLYSKGND